MANKIKGDVALTHGGRSYTMRLDMNALADFEGTTGRNAFDVLSADRMSITDMRALIHAGLQAHHEGLSLREAGEILQSNMGALGEAIAVAFPEAEAGNGKPAGKSRR